MLLQCTVKNRSERDVHINHDQETQRALVHPFGKFEG